MTTLSTLAVLTTFFLHAHAYGSYGGSSYGNNNNNNNNNNYNNNQYGSSSGSSGLLGGFTSLFSKGLSQGTNGASIPDVGEIISRKQASDPAGSTYPSADNKACLPCNVPCCLLCQKLINAIPCDTLASLGLDFPDAAIQAGNIGGEMACDTALKMASQHFGPVCKPIILACELAAGIIPFNSILGGGSDNGYSTQQGGYGSNNNNYGGNSGYGNYGSGSGSGNSYQSGSTGNYGSYGAMEADGEEPAATTEAASEWFYLAVAGWALFGVLIVGAVALALYKWKKGQNKQEFEEMMEVEVERELSVINTEIGE